LKQHPPTESVGHYFSGKMTSCMLSIAVMTESALNMDMKSIGAIKVI